MFLGYTLSVAFVNGGFFAFMAAAPFILVDGLGEAPEKVGLFLLYSTGGFLVGSLIGPRIVRRVGLDAMVVGGATSIFVFVAVMTAIGIGGRLSTNAIMIPMFLVGISSGFVFPPAAAAAVGVIPRISGTASGLLGFIQLGMGAVGTGIASLFVHNTQVPLALIMLGMATGGVASLWLIRRGRRSPPHP
jgi:DHA1 family bicyclomycin/chloramphenicol resistance-like MFS transporter